MKKEEIQKIMEMIAKAYEEAGRKVETAVLVDDIEDGEVKGEVLIDNRDEEEVN